MQTTINDTPVWITHLSMDDVGIDVIINTLGYSDQTPLSNLTPSEIYSACEESEGYYFACCSPGCMPDSDFEGPYLTEELALEAAKKFYQEV